MRPCLERLKDIFGPQSHFCKIGQKWDKIGKNFAISQYTKMQTASSGPDFYAISKMVHEISVRQKLAKLQAIFHF